MVLVGKRHVDNDCLYVRGDMLGLTSLGSILWLLTGVQSFALVSDRYCLLYRPLCCFMKGFLFIIAL